MAKGIRSGVGNEEWGGERGVARGMRSGKRVVKEGEGQRCEGNFTA